MVVLAIRSVTLPGAAEGLRFYLIPDFGKVLENGVGNVIFGAMSQAFFTLSIGMGGMAIFGSYIGKERSLLGESANIAILDTFVAIGAALLLLLGTVRNQKLTRKTGILMLLCYAGYFVWLLNS